MDCSKSNVLKELQDMFKLPSDEEIAKEVKLLRAQCEKAIFEARVRATLYLPAEPIVVRKCELSKLQFPQSQVKRSKSRIPVRYVIISS